MGKHERFWGLHFDFHAEDKEEIGIRTNPEDIEAYIRAARPTFLQCDTKGHPGISSYPTKVGRPAAHLHGDNLKIWCETARKHGLPIYAHYSSLLDGAYAKAHPEEVCLDENGTPQKSAGQEIISLFGSYVDNLMLPQLKELASDYGMTGVWIDGDCWAVRRDCSPLAMAVLHGPLTRGEHNRRMREAYVAYLRHVTEEMRTYAPDFQVLSNWAYSSYQPERPEVDLPSLSGDFSLVNSVHSARYEGRCLAAQGKPWDLMTWGFVGRQHPIGVAAEKPGVQLCQEAAMVLSLGGGFEVYVSMNPDGSAPCSTCERLREVGDFVLARRKNFGKPTVAQVGVFYSADARYRNSDKIYTPAGATNSLIGALNCVLDAQYTADVVMEYQLDRLRRYDMILIPEWTGMREEVCQVLLQYAQEGGALVLVGADVCVEFGAKVGQRFEKLPGTGLQYLRHTDGGFASVQGRFADVVEGEDCFYALNDLRDRSVPSYRIDAYGAGKIAYIPCDLGSYYCQCRSYILSDYLKRICTELCPPVVEINRELIDLSMQRDDTGILLNLVNMHQGRHDQMFPVYREVIPVHDVEITVHKPYRKVSALTGEPVQWEPVDGGIRIHLPKLEIHTVLELS